MDSIMRELIAAGYTRCPNVATRWYAVSEGIKEPARPMELHYSRPEGLSIKTWPYGKFNLTDRITVLRFTAVDELTHYLTRYGVPAPAGQPAYSNGWD